MLIRREFLSGLAAGSGGLAAVAGWARSPAATISDFGADLTSSTADHTLAFERAMASKVVVAVPALPGGRAYRLSRPLEDLGGSSIFGIGAIVDVSIKTTFLTLTGQNSSWKGITFRPPQDNTDYGIVLKPSCSGTSLDQLSIINGNSGLRIEGQHNAATNLNFYEMKGSSLRLEGTGSSFNTVSDVNIRNGALAGILHDDGAHHNTVLRAHKWVDLSRLPASFLRERGTDTGHLGGDVCAFAASAHHNRVIDVTCSGARDGCFTISGDDNELIGGIFRDGLASGCSISGSRNRISHVQSVNCKTGLRVIPQAGGLAKDNSFTECNAQASGEYGFRFDASTYREWQAGLTRQPATHFCSFQRAVYRTPHATPTFGTRPPVHRAGTVSDGLTDWTFVAYDPETLDPDRNSATRCSASGSGISDWLVRGSGAVQVLDCPGQPNGLLRGLPAATTRRG